MRRLWRFYTFTLPRWYVWLVMDAGCAATGHRLLCWNGPGQRLWWWTLEAPLPGEGEHRAFEFVSERAAR